MFLPSFVAYPGDDEPTTMVDSEEICEENPVDVEERCLVDGLPSDAWEKWCKDGVICFAIESPELLKVFFADPRDFSVYHVTDFDCIKFFGMEQRFRVLNCVLLGSKIYIIGCPAGFGCDALFYCDVAATQQSSEGYDWIPGPRFNSPKPQPYAFALDGNLYVISGPGHEKWGYQRDLYSFYPFEVLKKPDDGWKRLRCPASWWKRTEVQRVSLSSTIGDSKILVFDCFNGCLMYDAECDVWRRISVPSDIYHPMYEWHFYESSFHLLENANGVVLDPKGGHFLINFLSEEFESLPIHDSKCCYSDDLFEGMELDLLHWSLFQLKEKKYLFVLGLSGSDCKCSVVLGSFDLEDVSDAAKYCEMVVDSSDDPKPPLKMNGYRLTNLKTRCIPLTEGAIHFTHCLVK